MIKKLVIILMGKPGSGKGTQASLLADKLDLYHFETSKILEQEFSQLLNNKVYQIKGKIYSVKEEKERWEKGVVCSPPFVTFLVKKKIKHLFQKKINIVFSGSPRTLYEAKEIIPLLESLYGKENLKIFLIEISDKTSIFRNSNRKICSLFRHSILASPETKSLKYCPLDGSLLIKREKLDDPETIKIRLREYRKKTAPIFKYFKKRGLLLKKIKGERAVGEVFNQIISLLEKDDRNS